MEVNNFVVEGDDALRLYEIFKNSYLVKHCWQPFEHCQVEVEFSYEDGFLRVEERTTAQISYMAEILHFFAAQENIHSLSDSPEVEVEQESGWSDPATDGLPF